MLPMFVIPIVSQATQIASSNGSFFSQPIDVILYDILIWFGWIPIVVTLGWGFVAMWLNNRRGMYVGKLKYTLLAIDVPSMTEQTPKALENLFSSLYAAKSSITWKEHWIGGKLHPVFSFEIVSSEGYIQFIVRTQTRFRDIIEAGIYAHYPDAEISEVEDYAKEFPNEFPNDTHEMWGGEITLENSSIYPIRTYVDFEDRMTQEIKDPLGLTLEQMAKMRAGEHFWMQFVVQPSNQDWQKESLKHVRKIYGDEDKPKQNMFLQGLGSVLAWPAGVIEHAVGVDLGGLFGAAGESSEVDQWKVFKMTLPQKDEAEAILAKATKIGLGVKIRVLYVAQKNAFVKVERTGIVKGVLNQYTHLNLNKFTLFIPQVPKDDYFWMRWVYTVKQARLMKAYQGRSWGVGANPIFLNIEELATLWHFPTITMKAPLVKKSESKRGEPPTGLPITFLEDTLPFHKEPASAMGGSEDMSLSSESSGFAFSPVADEPLEESLPRIHAPVKQYVSEIEDERLLNVETQTELPEAFEVNFESQKQEEVDPFADLVEPKIPEKHSTDESDVVPPNLPI
ncbi:hypothetical protein HQ487_02340 [Candidatus Uhrbacteria bacterium]|nr:hypothetical protein [Candidatus Uhrbacteria bacterium]